MFNRTAVKVVEKLGVNGTAAAVPAVVFAAGVGVGLYQNTLSPSKKSKNNDTQKEQALPKTRNQR